MHEVVLVLDQVNIEAPLYATLAGFAVNVTVGTSGGCTVIVIDLLLLPPAPVQVNVYVPVVVSDIRFCELAVALFPFQALPVGPLPEHDTALTVDQVSLLESL
jgi:hypothetical protein